MLQADISVLQSFKMFMTKKLKTVGKEKENKSVLTEN